MLKLESVLDGMSFGQKYLCVASMTKAFSVNVEYKVKSDSEGYVYIEDDNGEPLYMPEDAAGESVTFKLVSKAQAFKANEIPTFGLNTEKTLTPSKIQETVQRLNGLTPAQAKLTELKQVSSKQETVHLDLAHLLLTSEAVQALKPGEECIVTSLVVDHATSKVTLGLSVGKVEREETEAVRVALEDLLRK